MTKHFFVGVDGGASKCIVRIEDDAGQLLGCQTSGPANIRLSVEQAWHAINDCVIKILKPLSLSLGQKDIYFHAGMGLAGCEMSDALQAFLSYSHEFRSLTVRSDADIACLGAHGGQDGAIIIAGTGTVGFQRQHAQTAKIGGWGFPHDDAGGGAWLGLEAVKLTLQWLDGRLPASELASAVDQFFEGDQDKLVVWANQANSTSFATLAPLVIEQAQAGDSAAVAIMQLAAQAIDRIGLALQSAQVDPSVVLPCALIGGVSPFLAPYLGQSLRARLRPCLASPDVGAVLLARQQIKEQV